MFILEVCVDGSSLQTFSFLSLNFCLWETKVFGETSLPIQHKMIRRPYSTELLLIQQVLNCGTLEPVFSQLCCRRNQIDFRVLLLCRVFFVITPLSSPLAFYVYAVGLYMRCVYFLCLNNRTVWFNATMAEGALFDYPQALTSFNSLAVSYMHTYSRVMHKSIDLD